MAATTKNSILRNLIFDISEIDETRNPFSIALNMAIALRNNEITSEEYTLLLCDLFLNCKRYNIETSNEICSLY